MNKNIVILYASVGGGHFKAAEGVKNYILKNYPDCKVEMVDALKYTNKVVDKIVIKSYVNMARYSPKVWGEIYKFSEKQYSVASFSNAVQKLLSIKLLKLLKDISPDAIITTHPFITEMVAHLKKRKKIDTQLNVIMTDYASHKFWELKPEYVNRYFVANEEMKYGLVHNGINKDKIFVTGIPFSPAFLEEHNKEEIYKEFDLNPQTKTVLFFGGGEYGLSNVKEFVSGLLNIKEKIQVVAIAGKNKRTQKMFKKIASEHDKKVIVLGYTTKIPELMSIANLVVSKPGGLTTTEILVSHVPFVIINPIPGQEEENSRFLLNNGAAIRIYNPEKATPLFEQLLNDSQRLEDMKKRQQVIAKPNSTKDIVTKILE